jgi:Na+/citrate or Na+/malate symporter
MEAARFATLPFLQIISILIKGQQIMDPMKMSKFSNKKGQFRGTGNIVHRRHRTKTNKANKENTAQKRKR